MDTPHIYVACLAAYNNGHLHGVWIEATQSEEEINNSIFDMLAKSPIEYSEEWAIHDYSGFGEVRIEEYESIEHVVKLSKFIVEYGALGGVLLGAFSIDDARVILEDHYHGVYDSEVDFARNLFEEYCSQAIPDNLIFYFDHASFARDLFINDYFSVEAQGQTHVFSYC